MVQTCHYRPLQNSAKEPESNVFDEDAVPRRTMDDDTTRSDPQAASSETSKTGHRYVQVLTRTLWLQALKQSLPGSTTREQRKVAVYRNRTVAIVHSVLHLVPLGGALSLVLLNATTTGFPVWRYDPTWNTAIQFAAKSLEILIQASLADVYLSYVRHQLLESGSVPLGVLFGPLQTTHIAYLWSLDFWGTLTAGQLAIPRKVVLFLFSFSIIALAALVGPSSAVAMIPRPMATTTARYLVLFDELQTLLPQQVGFSNVPEVYL